MRTSSRPPRTLGLALVGGLLLTGLAAATAAAPVSAAPGGNAPVTQLIVKYESGVSPEDAEGNATGDDELDEDERGIKPGKYLGFGYYSVTLPKGVDEATAEGLSKKLEGSSKVAVAEPDGVVTISGSGIETPATWGIDRIDQTTLPVDNTYNYSQSGAGVTAYIVDTGILPSHSEFAGRVRSGYTAITDGLGTVDCNGHGTHVSGTVAGTTYGVAKDASLVAVRVLDCAGSGTNTGVIAGINWATTDHASGPAVLNMSLGGGFSQALNDAVAAAVADGITVVVASGNSNADACASSPASAPTAITVNATDSADARATFSNYGSCTDIYAPGVSITSSWYNSNTATNTISGTSMASPHVAGAAARILEASPTLTPAQVWSAMSGAATSRSAYVTGDSTKFLYLAPGPVVPSAPSTPTALAVKSASSALTLTWAAPASLGGSPITGYTAQLFNASSNGTQVGGDCATATLTCTFSGLTNGTPYWAQVTATNSTGTSPATARVSGVPAVVITAPGQPTAVSAARGTSGQAVVRWTVPASNGGSAITGFTARAYTTNSGTTASRTCTVTGATATTCNISSLTNGTTYYVDVIAINAVGSSAASSPRVTVVPATVPGAPRTVRVTAAVKSAVVTWAAPSFTGGSPITAYTARAWSASTGGTLISSCGWTSGTLRCTIPALVTGARYYVDVVAINAVGTGTASARSSVTAR
jgi:subtilisin family serine protease